MANQVADFFVAYPSEQAVQEVAKHLKSFWDPRMRRQFLDYTSQSQEGLHPLVRQAVEVLAASPSRPAVTGHGPEGGSPSSEGEKLGAG